MWAGKLLLYMQVCWVNKKIDTTSSLVSLSREISSKTMKMAILGTRIPNSYYGGFEAVPEIIHAYKATVMATR